MKQHLPDWRTWKGDGLPADVTLLTDTRNRIRELNPPLNAKTEQQIRDLIDRDSQLVVEVNRQKWFQEFEEAKAAETAARARAEDAARRLDVAEAELRESPEANGFRAVLYSLASIACFTAEFVITWIALCFLLSVPMFSFRGVMLGIAPATALLVIEWAIHQLRLAEDPFKALQATRSRWIRAAGFALGVVFLAALVWANGNMVMLLAGAREESSKLKRSLEGVEEAAVRVDEKKLSNAVLWVSVMVTLSGAVLCLVGAGELRKLVRRGVLRVRVSRLRRCQTVLGATHKDLAARFNARQKTWDQAAELAEMVSQYARASNLFELEQVLSRPRPPKSSMEMVDERLSVSARRTDQEAARPLAVPASAVPHEA